MDEISPKELAQALLEKHDRLISEYSDEIEKMNQTRMLKEKRDQLKHWMEENGSQEKYAKELKDTENELDQIIKSFSEKNKTYYSGLEEQISTHREARRYWLDKISELKS